MGICLTLAFIIGEISPIHNAFKLIDVFSASDQPYHLPASFNVICIAGIHFAYISCY